MNRDPVAHLSIEELVGFILEDLPDDLAEEVERHLKDCEACVEELEEFYDAQSKFPEAERAAERESIAARPRERLATRVILIARWENVALAKAAATALRQSGNAPTPHGSLRWHRLEDSHGTLVAQFGSHALDLEGSEVWLKAGDFERSVRLKRAAPDQVGAEVVITRSERAAWPQSVTLDIKLIENPRDAAGETSAEEEDA